MDRPSDRPLPDAMRPGEGDAAYGHRPNDMSSAAMGTSAAAIGDGVRSIADAGAPTAFPPKGIGPLQRREMRLAYSLLIPTFLIVLSIVLVPLLANFWISAKPVGLADLRPARALMNERLRPSTFEAVGDEGIIQYRLRNSSQTDPITDVAFTDPIPAGLEATAPESCTIEGDRLTCEIGTMEAKGRVTIEVPVVATQLFLDTPQRTRDIDATVTASA